MNDIFEVHLNDIPERITDLTRQRNLLLNQHNEIVTKVHNFQYVLYALGAIALVAIIVYTKTNGNYGYKEENEA